MKPLTTMLLLLAVAPVWASEKADETTVEVAEALGIKENEKVPEHKRESGFFGDDHKTVRVADYPVKAGLDRIQVSYTDKVGVCGVLGTEYVSNAQDDDSGVRHKKTVDDIAERVEAKLGRPATEHRDFNNDTLWKAKHHWLEALKRGTAGYNFIWFDEDAKPFYEVYVEVESAGEVNVVFLFKNYALCQAEQNDGF